MVKRGIELVMVLIIVALTAVLLCGCFQQKEPVTLSRDDAIPSDAVKMVPGTESYTPVIHSDGWDTPEPVDGLINTAGAEDSPFITPDGNTFYFFFTPDVTVPVEKQLVDGVTGIWMSRKMNGNWTEPERVILCDDVSLDGCECVQGDTLWFASVRAGNTGTIDVYTASYKGGNGQAGQTPASN